MAVVERYRLWFEHEKAATAQVQAMLQSVPEEKRRDPRFGQALVLAAHISACRENWLDRMRTGGSAQTAWWPEAAALEDIPSRYAEMEAEWQIFLDGLTDESLGDDFEFWIDEHKGYRWNVEGQIMQLVGHGYYHRGQIVMIVDQLGGETHDTDFLFWRFSAEPERWKELSR
ncbi:MAG: DinB family protein [Fimbriimonas sp.]